MRILVVISEDWFALSHFSPIIAELALFARDVVVVTRSSGRLHEIRQLGVRVRPFDIHRGSLNVNLLGTAIDGLAQIIDEERPDFIHVIAMQPIVMMSLALARTQHRPSVVFMHVVGLGYLGYSRSPVALTLRPLALAAIRRAISNYNTWVLAENSDDLDRLVAWRAADPLRTAIVPGAGINPQLFPELPPPKNFIPHVAFVGRMLLTKGLGVLVSAHQQLLKRGIKVRLRLVGPTDAKNRYAIPESTLLRWSRLPLVKWCGPSDDIVSIWRQTDIAVVPSVVGEGLPRSILEAASSGRPIVTTDVSGCRHFVRNGVEGLLVRPRDSGALGAALSRLVTDRKLRLGLGAAARARVVENFSDHCVRRQIRAIYMSACTARRTSTEPSFSTV